MNKFLTMAAATIALTASQAANAQSFLTPGSPPTTPVTYTYSGVVDVQKDSILLSCSLTADIENTNGVLKAKNIALSGGFLGLCASVTFLYQPYSASWNSTTGVLTLAGFHPRAATNSTECHGDLDLVQDSVNPDRFYINATVPKISGSNDCQITNGDISYP